MSIEEAAKHYASVTDPEAHGIDFIREVFIAGAEWQKEHTMNGAVEGVIDDCGTPTRLSLKTHHESFRIGDKIHIIIVKEGKE